MLHLVGKQAYKLKLPERWRIHNIFYVSLLEQDTTKKEQLDKKVMELETGDSKEYKVETIWDGAVYSNKAKSHLSRLYYLILLKAYTEKENTWELSSAI